MLFLPNPRHCCRECLQQQDKTRFAASWIGFIYAYSATSFHILQRAFCIFLIPMLLSLSFFKLNKFICCWLQVLYSIIKIRRRNCITISFIAYTYLFFYVVRIPIVHLKKIRRKWWYGGDEDDDDDDGGGNDDDNNGNSHTTNTNPKRRQQTDEMSFVPLPPSPPPPCAKCPIPSAEESLNVFAKPPSAAISLRIFHGAYRGPKCSPKEAARLLWTLEFLPNIMFRLGNNTFFLQDISFFEITIPT